jgi:hypothetical protein
MALRVRQISAIRRSTRPRSPEDISKLRGHDPATDTCDGFENRLRKLCYALAAQEIVKLIFEPGLRWCLLLMKQITITQQVTYSPTIVEDEGGKVAKQVSAPFYP